MGLTAGGGGGRGGGEGAPQAGNCQCAALPSSVQRSHPRYHGQGKWCGWGSLPRSCLSQLQGEGSIDFCAPQHHLNPCAHAWQIATGNSRLCL